MQQIWSWKTTKKTDSTKKVIQLDESKLSFLQKIFMDIFIPIDCIGDIWIKSFPKMTTIEHTSCFARIQGYSHNRPTYHMEKFVIEDPCFMLAIFLPTAWHIIIIWR